MKKAAEMLFRRLFMRATVKSYFNHCIFDKQALVSLDENENRVYAVGIVEVYAKWKKSFCSLSIPMPA